MGANIGPRAGSVESAKAKGGDREVPALFLSVPGWLSKPCVLAAGRPRRSCGYWRNPRTPGS